MDNLNSADLNNSLLGKKTEYIENYDNSLLFPILRVGKRKFKGFDIWNIYEFSYLNNKGKPVIKKLKIVYEASSIAIIESKSLKLYLNSFSMTKFDSDYAVINTIKNDLYKYLKTEVIVFFEDFYKKKIFRIPEKYLIDKIDVEIDNYYPQSGILKKIENKKSKVYKHYSELLKSNCPITKQPDWATIYIEYSSKNSLDESSLLKYIVSFRKHNDFHEQCCERIYNDIYEILQPDYLIVSTHYTRRGGIDINPVRFSNNLNIDYTKFDKYYSRQ